MLDSIEPGLIARWSASETQSSIAFSIDRTRLVAAVRTIRPQVDTLIVFLHWGTELTFCASGEQGGLAKARLSGFSDIIVGSHAHQAFGVGRVGDSQVADGALRG